MSQNANTPLWAKLVFLPIVLIGALAIWQYAASTAFLWMLFHGRPVIKPMPWTLLEYIQQYHAIKQVMKPAVFALLITAAILFGFPAFLIFAPRERKLHGTARFAKLSEIKAAGLQSDVGALVGKLGNRFLRLADGHVQLSAATGTGKGTGFVTPNLLADDSSMVVTDPKLYSWSVTSAYRAKCGHKVFLFNPADPERRTHRWNALAYIRRDPAYMVDDTQRIAGIFFPDVEKTEAIWTASSRSLFVGLVLFLIETPGRKVTLGQLTREGFTLEAEQMKKALADRAAAGRPYSDSCVMALRDYLNAPDKARESIRKTFTSALELFQSPSIDAATAENDFDLRQLRREKMTIYLGVPPYDLKRLGPLLSLFFQQVVALNTDTLPQDDPTIKYPVRLLMDEFYILGKMPTLLDSIAITREYKVILQPVYQTEAQLVALYGQEAANSFLDNLTARIAYEPPRREAADTLAKELGQMTVTSRSKSKPTGMESKGSRSVSESQAGMALVSVDELLAMGSENEFIFVRGHRPIKCKKIFFFREPIFMDRLKSVSPSLKAVGRRLPTKQELDDAARAGELSPALEPVPLVEYAPLAGATDDRPSRPVEVGDLAKLNSLNLSDFDLNFSGIQIPTGEMDEAEMAELADTVYQQLISS